MGSLAHTLFSHSAGLGLALAPNSDQLQRTPLEQILSWIHFLPLATRKWLINVARVQAHPEVNQYLSMEYDKLPCDPYVGRSSQGIFIIDKSDVLYLATQLYDSELNCSILSYWCRAESTEHIDDFKEEKMKGFDKEISAALYFNPHQQVLDYSALFAETRNPLYPGISSGLQERTAFLFKRGIQKIKSTWSSMENNEVLLPYFNGRKTVGYATQEEFCRKTLPQIDPPEYTITTVDLMKHYYLYGEMIGGPLEPRCNWGFNDIKPRIYYCLAGDAYWASLYVKPIANTIIKILPSTNPESRFNIHRIGLVGEDQVLITYDYTSFTTSLSELKFFIEHLSEAFRGVTVDVLDVRHGIITIDVGDYLHDYNEAINQHQEIDLRRFFPDSNEGYIHYQGRSGSLGVQGNIVLSTFLHGLLLGGITGTPDADSCVGDDALALILYTVAEVLISVVNSIGEINPDKFTIIPRPPLQDPTNTEVTRFKYLKRPLYTDFVGQVHTGQLDAFPNLADLITPNGDGIHRSSGLPFEQACKSFVNQWGRYLIRNENSISLQTTLDTDLDILLSIIRKGYDYAGIPYEGCCPGYYALGEGRPDEGYIVDFFAPACDAHSVFDQNWVFDIYNRYKGTWVLMPVDVGGVIPPNPNAVQGETMSCTDSFGFLRLMEAMGLVEKTVQMREEVFDERMRDRLYNLVTGGVDYGEMLCDFFFREVPSWYFEMCIRELPELSTPDMWDSIERVHSVFSGTEYSRD